MSKGWGTNHPGIGACKFHGGATPNAVKAAASEELRTLLGKPMEINPLDALLWCIKIRAGEVKWLSEQMAKLREHKWTEQTIAGRQLHLWAKERKEAMGDLARFSQMAISLGIAERAVKLAEQYGEMISRLIEGILADLELSTAQKKMAPMIVRRHLLMIEGGADAEDVGVVASDRKALPTAERRAS
jgi:hypothetical protein